MRRPLQWSLILLLALQFVAYLGMVSIHLRHGTLSEANVPVTISWYLLAFSAYLFSIWQAEKHRTVGIVLIIGSGLTFRLILLFTAPTLSDDVYRYLWDGYVANQGVSPYRFPIDSPQLDYLDVPIRELTNHSWMASPYLPAAQWFFASVTGLLPLRPLSMQIAGIGVDLINAGLIVYLLGLAGLPSRRLLVYFWNPLVVLEVAHGAHVDVWMICLTLTAVALAYRPVTGRLRRYARWLSPLVLALATLTKILPILLSPVFFWRWNWPQRVIFVLTLMLVLLPSGLRAGWGISGELDGHGLFAALRIYGNQWNYNSGLFHWLEIGLHDFGGLDPHVALQWAKRTIGLVMFLLLVWTWWRGRTVEGPRTALRLMTVPLMGYVVLTPTFHPWYLLLLLAFVPYLTPTADEEQAVRWPVLGWLWPSPWLYLSGALSLSYLTYRDPLDLREFEWVRQIEWIPTLFLLLLAIGYSVWRKVDRPSNSTNG